mmetsp:Transcript_12824/g.23063  ORF Transcript_12824/g.23063 Transcript_12824/m.23063 type:complete len:119 (-) Transcript_12824:247-603(-)
MLKNALLTDSICDEVTLTKHCAERRNLHTKCSQLNQLHTTESKLVSESTCCIHQKWQQNRCNVMHSSIMKIEFHKTSGIQEVTNDDTRQTRGEHGLAGDNEQFHSMRQECKHNFSKLI